MLTFFAHAGEVHDSTNDSLLHYLGVWYIALIVFVVGTYVIATLTYTLTKKSITKALSALLIAYLLAGLTLYETSPFLSVLSIFSGFVIAALATFSSLTGAGSK